MVISQQNNAKLVPNRTIITRQRANILKSVSPTVLIDRTKNKCKNQSSPLKFNQKNITLKHSDTLTKNDLSVACQTDTTSLKISWTSELLSSNWLSDETIQKYTDLLNTKIIKGKSCTIINPLIVHAVKNVTEYDHFLEPLEIQTKDVLIMPVNDSVNLTHAGGTHWSLLVYNRPQKEFFHYDSLNNHNFSSAQLVARNMFKFLEKNSQNTTYLFKNIKGPQQINNFDCGIYLLFGIEAVVKSYLAGGIVNFQVLELINLNRTDLVCKRSTIAYVLNNLSNIQEDLLASLMAGEGEHSNKQLKHYENMNSQSQMNKEWKKVGNKQAGRTATKIIEKNYNSKIVSTNNYFEILSNMEDTEENMLFQTSKYSQTSSKQKPTQIKCWHKEKRKKHRILLLADSHGRGCSSLLQDELGEECTVQSVFKPNAKLNAVVENCKILTDGFTESDCVVIVGGTNDIKSDIQISDQKVAEIASSLDTNVLFPNIPLRFDEPWLNTKIAKINKARHFSMSKLALTKNNIILMDNDMKFSRKDYTRHGLHLNKTGKRKYCKMIAQTIRNNLRTRLQPNNQENNNKAPLEQSSVLTSGNSVISHSGSFNKTRLSSHARNYKYPIRVKEGNMKTEIETYKNDKSVAFTHCISGDFGSDRHMSAGVAVVFGNSLGKPLISHLVDTQLTFQQWNKDSAGVFGLVTKDKYYLKPSLSSYNTAFQQLTTQFKSKSFSHLICSPMGCTHDNVSVQHFIKNLTKFQQFTGAVVDIVTYNHHKNGIMKNGFPHNVFVKQIHQAIHEHYSQSNLLSEGPAASSPFSLSPQSFSELLPPTLESCMDLIPLEETTQPDECSALDRDSYSSLLLDIDGSNTSFSFSNGFQGFDTPHNEDVKRRQFTTNLKLIEQKNSKTCCIHQGT